MKIPDYQTCRRLLEDFAVPGHIVDHSCQVARVGVCIGRDLRRQGLNFDLDLLAAAGLLHDIAKIAALEKDCDHAELGAAWLKQKGYDEIAEIVRNHICLDTDLDGLPVARDIIYYADKRVRHAEIVSVAERMQDLKLRYGRDDSSRQWLEEMERFTLAVEKKLFTRLDFPPDRLCDRAAAIKIC